MEGCWSNHRSFDHEEKSYTIPSENETEKNWFDNNLFYVLRSSDTDDSIINRERGTSGQHYNIYKKKHATIAPSKAKPK